MYVQSDTQIERDVLQRCRVHLATRTYTMVYLCKFVSFCMA
jgi:hypothetical protein